MSEPVLKDPWPIVALIRSYYFASELETDRDAIQNFIHYIQERTDSWDLLAVVVEELSKCGFSPGGRTWSERTYEALQEVCSLVGDARTGWTSRTYANFHF